MSLRGGVVWTRDVETGLNGKRHSGTDSRLPEALKAEYRQPQTSSRMTARPAQDAVGSEE